MLICRGYISLKVLDLLFAISLYVSFLTDTPGIGCRTSSPKKDATEDLVGEDMKPRHRNSGLLCCNDDDIRECPLVIRLSSLNAIYSENTIVFVFLISW